MDGEKCHRKTHEKYEKPVRFLTMPYIFEKGILQPGEFLIIPNDPNYCHC